MRLNKYIASCGVASRRGADAMISAGRVSVNGERVFSLGTDVDPENDTVCVDGEAVSPEAEKIYIVLNKPAGVLCTCSDDRGRKTVLSLLGDIGARLYPVGRLDYDTEGLLLLTNDGDFAFRCTHPRHELSKTYHAVVRGRLDGVAIRALREGVDVDGRPTAKALVKVELREGDRTRLCITIREGRNRQVKKMFEAVGCRVEHLKRTAIGALELGDLEPGHWRRLKKNDFEKLAVENNNGETKKY